MSTFVPYLTIQKASGGRHSPGGTENGNVFGTRLLHPLFNSLKSFSRAELFKCGMRRKVFEDGGRWSNPIRILLYHIKHKPD